MTGPSDWINRHADLDPGRTCLRCSGRTMTYAEVRLEVDRWAGWMADELHLANGDVIWISTESARHQRLLRWAADRVGAIEAVVDPRLAPAEREQRIRTLRPTVRVDTLPTATPHCRNRRAFGADSRKCGRVLFSSGSSGRARAAVFDNAGLISAARSNIATRGISGADTLLCALPCFHAAGSLFEDSVLFAGGTLQLLEEGGVEACAEAINTGHPTITSLAPTQLRQLSTISSDGPLWGNLRLINYAGEAIDETTLRWLLETFKGRVNRGYGTTEAGPLISVLGNADHRNGMPDPRCLGRPAHGVACRVDPDGVLRVRSGHLMRGYVNDAAATAATLVDGWLVTGDLVEITDGRLTLLGRAEAAIRSGAEWVHPSEVERALERLTGVVESAVVAVPSKTWGQRPVAFVLWDQPVAAEALREGLGEHIAPFKWPDWIEPVAALPRTGTNKVDRSALAERAAFGPSDRAVILRDLKESTHSGIPRNPSS